MDQALGDGKAVRATVPTAPGKSRSRAQQGRVCEHEGCETVLSTYNSETTCWTHQKPISGERRSETSRPVVPMRLGSNPMVFPAA
jgi:hypothetical protein